MKNGIVSCLTLAVILICGGFNLLLIFGYVEENWFDLPIITLLASLIIDLIPIVGAWIGYKRLEITKFSGETWPLILIGIYAFSPLLLIISGFFMREK